MAATAESSTSNSLLLRTCRFEGEAWERFARLYSPIIYRWCRQSQLQPSDIEDVSQEVFRGVVNGLSRYLKERPAKFRAWLWGITRNKVTDHFRTKGRIPDAIGGDEGADLLALATNSLSGDYSASRISFDTLIVQRTLEFLRSEFEAATWKSFWRLAVDGENAASIAADLGMTKKAVRQAKYRVLRRLRQELDVQLDEPLNEASEA